MAKANLADLGHEKLAQLIQDAFNEGYQRGLGDGYHQAREDARAEAKRMATPEEIAFLRTNEFKGV